VLYAKVIGSFSFSKNSYRVRKKTKCLSLEVFCGFVYIDRDPMIVLFVITHGHSHICFLALLQIPNNYALWKFLHGFYYLYKYSGFLY